MITKTEYRVISPANKKIDRNEIEVEITETRVEKRTTTIGALDSAIDIINGSAIRYRKEVDTAENNVKIIKKERSELDKRIKKLTK